MEPTPVPEQPEVAPVAGSPGGMPTAADTLLNDPEEGIRRAMAPSLQAIREDIISLAKAIQVLNNYGARVPTVNELLNKVLAPDPHTAEALEELAKIKALPTKIGRLIAVTSEWDDEWRFMFSFRFENGWHNSDGFDLRPNRPGLAALKAAIDHLKIGIDLCDFNPPEAASGPIPNRRVIYPKA